MAIQFTAEYLLTRHSYSTLLVLMLLARSSEHARVMLAQLS